MCAADDRSEGSVRESDWGWGEVEMDAASDVVMAGSVVVSLGGVAQSGLAGRWAAVAPAQGSRQSRLPECLIRTWHD